MHTVTDDEKRGYFRPHETPKFLKYEENLPLNIHTLSVVAIQGAHTESSMVRGTERPSVLDHPCFALFSESIRIGGLHACVRRDVRWEIQKACFRADCNRLARASLFFSRQRVSEHKSCCRCSFIGKKTYVPSFQTCKLREACNWVIEEIIATNLAIEHKIQHVVHLHIQNDQNTTVSARAFQKITVRISVADK